VCVCVGGAQRVGAGSSPLAVPACPQQHARPLPKRNSPPPPPAPSSPPVLAHRRCRWP
jgi:hypothetical protein